MSQAFWALVFCFTSHWWLKVMQRTGSLREVEASDDLSYTEIGQEDTVVETEAAAIVEEESPRSTFGDEEEAQLGRETMNLKRG